LLTSCDTENRWRIRVSFGLNQAGCARCVLVHHCRLLRQINPSTGVDGPAMIICIWEISRIGRFAGSVLWVSDAATLALKTTRPSIESHRPSTVCILFATTTCLQVRSSARLSRRVNAAATRPADVDVPDPLRPGPG
jgi:membrane-bound lytic murein transglycosylase B